MNYLGGKLTTGDIRWNMRKNGISWSQMEQETGIPERKIQDILSLQYVPEEYADKLMDAIFALKKRRVSKT